MPWLDGSTNPKLPHTGSFVSRSFAEQAKVTPTHASTPANTPLRLASKMSTKNSPLPTTGLSTRVFGGGGADGESQTKRERRLKASVLNAVMDQRAKAQADIQQKIDQSGAPGPGLSDGAASFLLIAKEKASRIKSKNKYIIDPSNPKKIAFDFLIGACVFYTSLVVPFRSAFGPQRLRRDSFIFAFEAFMDCFFATDIVLNFFTAFEKDEMLVQNRARIRQQYLRTWFFPDTASTIALPMELIFHSLDATWLKMLRLLRLAKLLRLVKVAGKMANMNINEYINPALLQLVSLMVKILMVAHFIACGWFMVNECSDLMAQCGPGSIDCSGWGRGDGVWTKCGLQANRMSQYVASFYFAIATMMAVGYGDISASNVNERLFAIMTQLIGAICFGFIVATVTMILETYDPCATARKEKLEEIVRYANEKELPFSLQVRMRRHLKFYYQFKSNMKEGMIMRYLPDHVRWKLIFFTRQSVCNKLHVSRHLDVRLMLTIAHALKPAQFVERDIIAEQGEVSEEVYFVTKGAVLATMTDDTQAKVLSGASLPMFDPVRDDAPALASSPERDVGPTDVERTSTHRAHFNEVVTGVFRVGSDFEMDSVHNRKPCSATYVAITGGELLWLTQSNLWGAVAQHPLSMSALQKHCAAQRAAFKRVLEQPLVMRGSMRCRNMLVVGDRAMELAQVDRMMPRLFGGNYTDTHGEERILMTWRLRGVHTLSDELRMHAQTAISTMCWWRASRVSPVSPTALGGPKIPSFRRAVSMPAFDDEQQEPFGDMNQKASKRFCEDRETSSVLLRRLILDPGHPYKLTWDIFVGSLTVLMVFLLPAQMGQVLADTTALRGFLLFVDVSFLTDIAANFRTPFVNDAGVFDTVPVNIGARYLRTWFVVDFLSSVDMKWFMGEKSGAAGLFKMLRLVRLFKLFRLAKLKNLQVPLFDHVDFTVKKGMYLFLTLACLAHVFGCFWNAISYEANMLPATQWSWRDNAYLANITTFELGPERSDYYAAGIYWAMTTMTTVGYGDIAPENDVERLYAIVIMLLGATIFGYVVGSVSALTSDPNSITVKTNRYINMVSQYLIEQGIEKDTRLQVRAAVRFVLKQHTPYNEVEILNMLPREIRNAVVTHGNRELVRTIPILRNASCNTVAYLVQAMTPCYFSKGQELYNSTQGADAVYFVVAGRVQLQQHAEAMRRDLACQQTSKPGKASPLQATSPGDAPRASSDRAPRSTDGRDSPDSIGSFRSLNSLAEEPSFDEDRSPGASPDRLCERGSEERGTRKQQQEKAAVAGREEEEEDLKTFHDGVLELDVGGEAKTHEAASSPLKDGPSTAFGEPQGDAVNEMTPSRRRGSVNISGYDTALLQQTGSFGLPRLSSRRSIELDEPEEPEEVMLIVSTFEPGMFFGYESLLGEKELPHTRLKAVANTDSYALLAAEIAHMSEAQPAMFELVRGAIAREARLQQQQLLPEIEAYRRDLKLNSNALLVGRSPNPRQVSKIDIGSGSAGNSPIRALFGASSSSKVVPL